QDGFVSLNATLSGGSFVTRVLVFAGTELHLNFATSAAGTVQVEIQDPSGTPLPGFALNDSPEIFGDSIDYVVQWTAGASLNELAGKMVRLRFKMSDADLFSIRFQ
ncbi:hypothetical protein L0128_16090, partial [candidate division KSB1 bacterium]|nr:hypothetical protein [candidate division KSB1 bacterium]